MSNDPLKPVKIAYIKTVLREWRRGGGAWLLDIMTKLKKDNPENYRRAMCELDNQSIPKENVR